MWRHTGWLMLAVIAGCAAPIKEQTIISTPVAQPLVAGVGDTVLRAENRESLPNAFGKADVFGRTRAAGYATIQFGGMQGGKVLLLRSSVVTQSQATTVNHNAVIPPGGVSSTQPTIPIVVDWRANPRVPALGRTIVIDAADSASLTYHVE